jgi:16S rRNA (adenine1518-N6/adenine1519-N6)-dimethyltransferase
MSGNAYLEIARNLRAKKRFSQNFLVEEQYLDAIVRTLDIKPDDTVLEIGPGSGFLTEKLIARAGQVVAVELERGMLDLLHRKYHKQANLILVESDILKFSFETVPAPTFKVVGNLPYNLTSPILFLLAGELHDADYPLRKRIERITVMVQKEVGERIAARPGTKAYNSLSISLQYRYQAEVAFTLPSTAFHPQPKVDSAVVTLIPREAPLLEVADYTLLSRLVRTAFAQRRKTIRNALRQNDFAAPDVLDRIFEETGINSGLRAEAIAIEDYGRLANAFHHYSNTG